MKINICETCGKETKHPRFCCQNCYSESLRGKSNPNHSISMKELWQDPNSKYHSENRSKLISESNTKRFSDPEARENHSSLMKDVLNRPTCKLKSKANRYRNSKLHKKLWADPNSGYRNVSGKVSITVKALWNLPNSIYRSEERNNKISVSSKNRHKDPNDKWNTTEFLENHCKTGFGKYSYASDGHLCQSQPECIFDDWLSSNRLAHKIRPRIPVTGRIADFLVNDCYIEIDGMHREQKYWISKFLDSGVKYMVLKANNIDALKQQLSNKLLEELKNGRYNTGSTFNNRKN